MFPVCVAVNVRQTIAVLVLLDFVAAEALSPAAVHLSADRPAKPDQTGIRQLSVAHAAACHSVFAVCAVALAAFYESLFTLGHRLRNLPPPADLLMYPPGATL